MTVVGRLVDDERRPLAGGQVELTPAQVELASAPVPTTGRVGESSGKITAETDERGAFRLEVATRGIWTLTASSPGWVPFRQAIAVRPSSEGMRTIDLGVLGLRRGHELIGLVVDPRGQPVTDAEIELHDEVFETWQGSARTDAEGRFRLRTQATGAVLLTARSASRPPMEIELNLPLGGLSGVRLALRDGFELRGTVVDPRGRPVPGARLTLVGRAAEAQAADSRPGDGSPGPRQAAWTDERGRFSFAAVGRTAEGIDLESILVDAPGWPEHRFRLGADHRQAVELVERAEHEDGDGEKNRGEPALDLGPITLPPGTAVLGRVVGLAPSQLGRAEITAVRASRDRVTSARARPRADGSFRFDGLGPGAWRLQARVDEGPSTPSDAPSDARRTALELTLAPGQAEAEVELRFGTGAPFAGTVHFQGEAAAGLVVTAVALGNPTWTMVATDDDGRFRFPDLAVGAWLLRVEDRGRDFSHALAVEVPSVAELELDLRPVRVRGRLVARPPEPGTGDTRSAPGIAEARLRLRPVFDDGNGASAADSLLATVIGAGATTDADGAFRLWATFQGPAELQVRSGDRTWVERIEIPDQGIDDLVLSVP